MTAFVEALRSARVPLIMEIKVSDGHGAALLGDRDPRDVVDVYQAQGAPCVSVVTGRWFGGSPQLLDAVLERARVPVLLKDFITRRGRIVEAAGHGVSAVLLTAATFSAGDLRSLVAHTLDLGVTPFVEVASRDELAKIGRVDGCVVAVNNSDIATRETISAGVSRSLSLIDEVRASGPAAVVSASGISSPAEAVRVLAAGYDALLVGSALLRAPDIPSWIASVQSLRAGLP